MATCRSPGRGRRGSQAAILACRIEERYPNFKSYYLAATIEANKMINERLLLPEDATRQLGRLYSDMHASNLLPLMGLPVPITPP